jgi:hypothetical protein
MGVLAGPNKRHVCGLYKRSLDVCSTLYSDLTIVCRIDLNDSGADGEGGWVPMWIYVKTIGHTAAASIHKMRQALLSDQASYSDAVVAQVGNEPADAN